MSHQISWVDYVNSLLTVTDYPPVTSEENVVVYAPEYLEQLNELVTEKLKTEDGKKFVE